MKTILALLAALLLVPLAAMSAFAGETPSAAPVVPKDIKAYCLDFNWGPGGPNAFAKPGLWADADPAQARRVVSGNGRQCHPDLLRLLQRLRLV